MYETYDVGYAGAVASPEFSFMSPKKPTLASLPIRIAFVGDPGVTANTSTTMTRMLGAKPDVVVLAGCVCVCARLRVCARASLAAAAACSVRINTHTTNPHNAKKIIT